MLVTITNNSPAVTTQLSQLPARLDRALATGLARGLLYALALAQRQYLSGPRPLKLDVRTTRLRNSLASEVQTATGNITGRLGTNLSYAAFHEFGFHGVVNVRAHSRVIGTLDAAGNRIDQRRSLRDDKGNFIGYRESHARANSRTGSRAAFVFNQQVRAHTRKLNYAGRPYLRPALEAAAEVITQEIKKEVTAL